MLFVSKSPEHRINIRREVSQHGQNVHGQMDSLEIQPQLAVQFQPKRLSGPERERADARFKQLNPQNPYGAMPYRDNNIMGSQFNEEEVSPDMPEPYVGFDPKHMLGSFNTATDIEADGQPEEYAELRRMIEERLLLPITGINDTYILLDDVTVEKPWPSYPLEGQGRHLAIKAFVEKGGFDPNLVIMFEQAQDSPGLGVITAMEALLAERDAERAEDDALSARVPG